MDGELISLLISNDMDGELCISAPISVCLLLRGQTYIQICFGHGVLCAQNSVAHASTVFLLSIDATDLSPIVDSHMVHFQKIGSDSSISLISSRLRNRVFVESLHASERTLSLTSSIGSTRTYQTQSALLLVVYQAVCTTC